MFETIVLLFFYGLVGLWFLGLRFPFMEQIIGILSVILAILVLVQADQLQSVLFAATGKKKIHTQTYSLASIVIAAI